MVNGSVKIKTYFLIFNLFVSIIAFNVLVSAQDEIPLEEVPGENTVPESTTTTPPIDTPISQGGANQITIGNSGNGSGVGIGGNSGVGDGRDDGDNTVVSINWMGIISKVGMFSGIGGTIGQLMGGDDGVLWGSISGAAAGVVSGLLEPWVGSTTSMILGIGVGAIIFAMTYGKASIEIVEFHCLPWQAPVGGDDCELCQTYGECSEYTCKSLGQACEIVNAGTMEQKCVWVNPHDVNSPIITFGEVNKGLVYKPDLSIRPPSTGVVISRESEECIQAFTPLRFTFRTNEPASCKIDYNLTTGFEEMSFYVGGVSILDYNHTEELSLPGPEVFNAIAPELQNDGDYSLFVRCQDANGNFNQDAYSVSFCVDKGPDTTPPKIVNVNIPSNNPVLYDQMNIDLEVYVNEPSECKWDREDKDFANMNNDMKCALNVWEMNNENVYTCTANLSGIENRAENDYYFRCKDKPWASEGDRNTNAQSYLYKIIGTQPLNILDVKPSGEELSGATNLMPVFLEITTDNGYSDGESLCYYHSGEPLNEEDYILFSDTKSNEHIQRQDLPAGDYEYYLKCVDLGGNTIYETTTFSVETDREAPLVIRTYRESSDLKIITSEKAECTYSTQDCNFEIDSGVVMGTFDSESHTSEWVVNQNYFIRCKDEFNNQPYPNVCSIILRPAQSKRHRGVIIL